MIVEHAVFNQTLFGEITKSTTYDQVTHFIAGDKYVTVYYGEGRSLIYDETLKAVRDDHPELVYVHRSALVKPELIELLWRDPDLSAHFINITGSAEFVRVSRRLVPKIRALIESRKELQA